MRSVLQNFELCASYSLNKCHLIWVEQQQQTLTSKIVAHLARSLCVHDDEASRYQFNATLTMWFLSSSSLFILFTYSKTNWKVKIPKCLIIGPHWSKSSSRDVTWLVKMPNTWRRCRSISSWVLFIAICFLFIVCFRHRCADCLSKSVFFAPFD